MRRHTHCGDQQGQDHQAQGDPGPAVKPLVHLVEAQPGSHGDQDQQEDKDSSLDGNSLFAFAGVKGHQPVQQVLEMLGAGSRQSNFGITVGQ